MALFFEPDRFIKKYYAENNNSNHSSGQGSNQNARHDSTIGNQQATAQTWVQNGGGENIDQQEDEFTEDLRQSGDQNSSNQKEAS